MKKNKSFIVLAVAVCLIFVAGLALLLYPTVSNFWNEKRSEKLINDYIANVKFGKFSPFRQKLWQRNYYEHIIRDDRDYYETAKYIENNLLKWELDKYYCKD